MVAAPDDDDDGSLARLLSRFRGGFESFPRSLVGPSSSTGERATKKKNLRSRFPVCGKSWLNRFATIAAAAIRTHTDGYIMRALENNQLESWKKNSKSRSRRKTQHDRALVKKKSQLPFPDNGLMTLSYIYIHESWLLFIYIVRVTENPWTRHR